MRRRRCAQLALAAIVVAGCRREPTGARVDPPPRVDARPPAPSRPLEPADVQPAGAVVSNDAGAVDGAFCSEGFASLDAPHDACLLVPAGIDPGAPKLLVYLHGIVPPAGESPQKANVLHVVRSAATRAGVVALVPRGVRGIGPKGAKDWYAWPTSPADHGKLARGIVARWAEAKRAVERQLGVSFARTYLAGSSNGAYFLAALALRGDLHAFGFDVDGLGAMSGGGTSGLTPARDAPWPPFYVGWGTYDPATKKGAAALSALLVAARWPSKSAEHALGHGAREVYLDEALGFWETTLACEGLSCPREPR